MKLRSIRLKTVAGAAALALMAVPLAACGTDEGSSSSGSGDTVEAVAVIPDINNGVSTQITVAQEFVDALDSLKLTPAPTRDAEFDAKTGTFTFPITGGNVSLFEPGSVPNYVVGQIQHENSGLSLSAEGGPTVEIGNFNVDPGISRVYGDVAVDGKVAATSVYLFRLDGSTLKKTQMKGDEAILEGTTIYISDVAAGLLNKVFGTDGVTDQQKVGVAKITVNTNTK